MLQSDRIFNRLKGRLIKVSTWLDIPPRQVLFLILSIPISLIVPFAAGTGPRMINPVTAICAWLLSITLVLVSGFTHRNVPLRLAKSTLLWIEILAVTAFMFRGLATNRFPIVLTGDEGSVGIEAANFLTWERNNIFVVGWFSFPTLFYFIQSLSIRILGQTTEALRIPSAMAGTLTVIALYLAGKKMFNARVGLLAALSLTALHFHIHFSRIGLNNIWDGLWYVVVIGSLWVGWHHEDRRAYLFAGVGLGLSQYFYPSSRSLFVILLAFITLTHLSSKQKLRHALPHLFVMMLIALIIFLPLGWFYVTHPLEYIAPLERVSIFGEPLSKIMHETRLPAWRVLITRIGVGLQAYTFTPLLFWYKPGTPILLPLSAMFFFIGLFLLAFRHRDSRLVLLALWLAVFGISGGLSDSTPAAQRYVAAAPACSLIIGIGLDGSANYLSAIMPKAKRFISILVFVAIASIMLNNLYFYFVKYTQNSRIQNNHSNGMIAQRLADELEGKPTGLQVFFFGTNNMGYYSIQSTSYLVPQVIGIDINQPWASLGEKPNLLSDTAIFVFLPERGAEINAVRMDYPDGTLATIPTWDNDVLFWLYEVHKSP